MQQKPLNSFVMILRIILQNFFSFKEQTEFNLFPSSRSTQLTDHIVSQDHTKVLRMSAIYGANGAGKSNLIKAVSIIQRIIVGGSLDRISSTFYKMPFLLKKDAADEPVSAAVEFYHNGIIYYYSISFEKNCVLGEELYVSKKDSDEPIFSRRVVNGIQEIDFCKAFMEKDPNNPVFAKALAEKILAKTDLLISFMGEKYTNEIAAISDAYSWFCNNMKVVEPSSMSGITAHLLDSNPEMLALLNKTLPEMNTGISKIEIKKIVLREDDDTLSSGLKRRIQQAKESPGVAFPAGNIHDSRVYASVVYENNECILKMMQPLHVDVEGTEFFMPLESESDGTIRLIDYIPFIYSILHEDKVYFIDEIERSVHPIMIKLIVSKISENSSCRGQLIFTTHESCLLDQKILRADEIWFAQKDSDQASHIYPLSDFNIHKTANIELGYLNGRYGGIPFLSNLKDLHW